jgi:hypothetical protein
MVVEAASTRIAGGITPMRSFKRSDELMPWGAVSSTLAADRLSVLGVGAGVLIDDFALKAGRHHPFQKKTYSTCLLANKHRHCSADGTPLQSPADLVHD